MSEITYYTSYKSLPHILLVDDTFHITDCGVFDPEWAMERAPYKPGKFMDYKGDTTYDDSPYKDKGAMVLSFKHKFLGNFPIARNVGRGHFHIKYIVPNNEIDPFSVMKSGKNGDIVIFATLLRNPPVTTIRGNNSQETLIEVRPYLTPEEMEKLTKDINFVSKIIEDNKAARSESYRMRAENILLLSRIKGGESTILLLQEKVNSLLKRHEMLMDHVIQLKLDTQDRLKQGIETIEGKYDLGVQWDNVVLEDTEKTIAALRADIRRITALSQMEGKMNDNMKQILLQEAINAIGDINYVRQVVGNMSAMPLNTATGQQSVQILGQTTPVTRILDYASQHENKAMSNDEFSARIRDEIERIQKEIDQHPNSAIDRTQTERIVEPIRIPTTGRQQPGNSITTYR